MPSFAMTDVLYMLWLSRDNVEDTQSAIKNAVVDANHCDVYAAIVEACVRSHSMNSFRLK